MRLFLLLTSLLCGSALATQQPELHASEVAALRHLQRWVAGPANEHRFCPEAKLGYTAVVFGFDRQAQPVRGPANVVDAEQTSVLLMQPARQSFRPGRLLFANRAGRIFVGERADTAQAWQPSVATFAGPGVDVHLNNMLLESGTAVDGTVWRRIDDLPALQARQTKVRLVPTDGARLTSPRVEVGMGRLPWHPAWLPLGPLPSASLEAVADAGAPNGAAIAAGGGVIATDLCLFVHGLRLSREHVTAVDGELVVRYDASMVHDSEAMQRWDDQAWAVQALRLLAQAQLQAHAAARVDADVDGKGEFGTVTQVMPVGSFGTARPLPNGRYLFREHLFEVHVSSQPDAAEQHFVAYAWPATPRAADDLAFVVDESGIVRSCAAHARFAGHDAAPTAQSVVALTWQPLR